jgi:perosamine synthetase
VDVARLVEALRRVIGDGAVQLHEPEFIGHERDYVLDCIDTGWVSSVGAYVDRFGVELGVVLGTGPVAPVVNGTAALHLALELVGVEADDEVIVPALSFVATANAVVYCGAHPHFVDSELVTFGMDAGKLETHLQAVAERTDRGVVNRATGRRISAIVPVHIFGRPADLDKLTAVAERWDLPLVEDAAESLGSTYKGRAAGSFGVIAALSFNGNKIITTGGGGAIATTDPDLARRAKHISTTARVPHRWSFDHDEIGYNYRMPEKRALAQAYRAELEGMPGLTFVTDPPEVESNYWLNAIMLDDPACRDEVIEGLNAAGLGARPCWRLLCDLTPYASNPRSDLSTARLIESTVVNIPSSARLGRPHLSDPTGR